jgi:hypothetical protein
MIEHSTYLLGTVTHECTWIEHQDLVRVAYEVQPMCNGNDGCALEMLLNHRKKHVSRIRVQVSCRLVKYQHLGFPYERTCGAEQLLLPVAEIPLAAALVFRPSILKP